MPRQFSPKYFSIHFATRSISHIPNTVLEPKQINLCFIRSSNSLPIFKCFICARNIFYSLFIFLARIHSRFIAECLCLETTILALILSVHVCMRTCSYLKCVYGCHWTSFFSEARLALWLCLRWQWDKPDPCLNVWLCPACRLLPAAEGSKQVAPAKSAWPFMSGPH